MRNASLPKIHFSIPIQTLVLGETLTHPSKHVSHFLCEDFLCFRGGTSLMQIPGLAVPFAPSDTRKALPEQLQLYDYKTTSGVISKYSSPGPTS